MRHLIIAAALLAGAPTAAVAQPYARSTGPRAGSFEFSAGALWNAGYGAGSRAAVETPNTTAGASPLTLFATDSRVAGAPGVDARGGVYLGKRLSAEGGLQFSRPVLRTSLTSDFENAAPLQAEDVVSSYVFSGSLLYHFGEGRLVPFVLGGGGYLRQLHEGNTDVLTGNEVHGGAGLKYWFGSRARRPGKRIQRAGLRVEAVASSRSRSAGFEDKRKIVPCVMAGFSYLF